jgi:DNA-binding MarR family transcriptional regulator
MRSPLDQFDKVFESRIRLSIMTILMVEESIDYNQLKAALEVTDGNLASHIKALEKEEYIEVMKSFFGKKPNTSYKLTKLGRKSFEVHLSSLERLINQIQPPKIIKNKN